MISKFMLKFNQGFIDVKRIVKFMKRLNQWISLHDVSSVEQHQSYSLMDKMLYYSSLDELLHMSPNLTSIPSYKNDSKKDQNLINSMPNNKKVDEDAIKKTNTVFNARNIRGLFFTESFILSCRRNFFSTPSSF